MHFPEQLPLASADDIRTLDRLTCERQNISALQLMARAASCCTAKLLELYPDNHHWTVVAGPGNNGGDGLVIARQLFMRGDSVQVYRPQNRPCGAEHDTNAARLERLLPTADLAAFTPPGRGVLIDALFGVGTNRPLAEPYASLVAAINRAPVPVVAIDLPSGLQAEQAPEADTAIVHATHTLCLGCPKAALLWAEHEPYVGTLYLLPIGLDRAALAEIPGARWLDPAWLRTQYRPRRRFAHKGDAGRLLLVAGSRGMTGAALMAAQAALRSGCGLLTAHLPAACTTAFHAQITEAMSDADPHPEHNSRLTRDIPADALLLGCGLGTHADTAALLHDLAERYHDRPMVWDADALNLLAADPARPLELNIIDNYQGGETRSAKNLSGGESFIVSLALALGLAQISGENMQIDTLFLDEGFGTLDEETLDSALETLAQLRKHGKHIGIISHVAALTERIATRIQITPQNGGNSIISGPGCRRVE